MSKLRVEVVLAAIDKATAPLRGLGKSSKSTSKEVRQLQDTLKALSRTQETVEALRNVSRSVGITSQKFKEAQQTVARLRQNMAASDKPTRAQAKAFEQARQAAAQLKAEHSQLIQRQQRLRTALREAGVDTTKLANAQRELRSRSAAASSELERQKVVLARLNEQQRKLNAAQDRYRQGMDRRNSLAANGAAMAFSGGAMLRGLGEPLNEGKHYAVEEQRIAALGLGDKATTDAIKYGKALKTYGTSTLDNLQLVRDAMTVFADEHHAELVAPTLARMKFANRAMYGDEKAEDNERQFMDMLKVVELRGGLANEAAFKQQANMIQQVLTATGGRVSAEEWLNVIKTGGLAAKGQADEAFFYKLEALVQEMGGNRVGTAMMSAYQNLYQGRTTKRAAQNLESFGLIGDYSKVQHDKAGQVSFLNPGALKGAELFRKDQFAWMEQVLLPSLAAKGLTSKDQVLDAIGSIFSNRTAGNLFGQMYLQREQIHKNAKLNAGADGIDQLYDKAKTTSTGKELELLAKRANLYKQISDGLMPTYNRLLEAIAQIAERLTSWAQAHPALAAAIVKTVAALAILVTVLGAVALAMAAVMGPFVMARFAISTLGIRLGAFAASSTAGASAVSTLGSAFSGLGGIIATVGRMLFLSPIGLIIGAIAVAALLIWKYWEPVKAFFGGVFDGISEALAPLADMFDGIKQAFAPLMPLFDQLFTQSEVGNTTLAVFASIGYAVGTVLGWLLRAAITPLAYGIRGLVAVFGFLAGAAANVWQQITTAFEGGWQGIGLLLLKWSPLGWFLDLFRPVLAWFGVELPGKFAGFGSMMIDGLKNGLKAAFPGIYATLKALAEKLPEPVRKALDINSPSRVFAEIGGFTMQGLAEGLANKQRAPLAVAGDLARQLATVGMGLAIGAPALAGQLDHRPAGLAGPQGATVAAAPSLVINVYPSPGMDEQALARLVAREVQRIQHAADRRQNTRLGDKE
ncbi:phage tail tape measure protein [Chitiniphilus eburneus]|uniref:phage tail tape measure protein n=1 Tax=Chitiniphilus eburneus TaxID=2571148 RepID=UPI0035CF6A29